MLAAPARRPSLVPDSGPALIVDQGRLLAGEELTLVRYLAGVNRVRKQCVEMTAREGFAAALRPLGISSVRDRVCMTAATLVLEPIFEADLPPEQYAYRPGRSAQQAAVEVEELLFRGHREVVDADLADFLEAASYCPPAYEVRSNRVG